MRDWLESALAYLPEWLDYQVRQSRQTGCALAVADGGQVVLERAFGVANAATGEALTSRHRFRVASHSKTFTATGVLKLVEAGRVRLDDRIGQHVSGLHPEVARVDLRQLQTHSAGIIRDGLDAGQWLGRRPFLDEAELRAALAEPPVIDPGTRFKYSNHAYGLLGLLIEAVTGERYGAWIRREVVVAAGLAETEPDTPLPPGTPLSSGHSTEILLGSRVLFPGDTPTRALAAATGFASTAGDLVRFFSQLSPARRAGLLGVESRRELARPHWSIPDMGVQRDYGLGTIGGTVGNWRWFGHSGGFQGFLTHSSMLPEQDIAISILTNSNDAPPVTLVEGAIRILQVFAEHGAPQPAVQAWRGRWWSLAAANDLVPMGDRVLLAAPGQANPFADVSRLQVTGADEAVIARAGGFLNHGERVRIERDGAGMPVALWVGGTKLLSEADAARDLRSRYAPAG